MNGKYFYFALASLLGVLCALFKFMPFFLLTFIYLFILYKYKRFTITQLAIVIAIFFLFFLLASHEKTKNNTVIPDTTTMFISQYLQDPKIDGDLLQVVAFEKKYQETILIRFKIKDEQEKEALKGRDFYGCICRISGMLVKPAIAKNPNGFNYRKYLSTKKIYWLVEIQENPLQNCTPIKPSLLVLIKKLRFSGINYLESHFPPEIASLSAALIFGDRSLLDPNLLEDYQKTGIVHLLAISGLHVTLLVGMVFYMGIRLGLTRQFMTNFLLLVLPFYAILTGGSPSVVRSVMMIFLLLIAVRWKGKLKLLPIDAISIAFMMYLLFTPLVLFDVGFQLSFSVSFAIIVSAPFILKRCQKNIAKMLATSAIAQLAALPFLLFHYFEISLISMAANLVYIPLFSFVYLPGLYLLFIVQLIFGKTPLFINDFLLKIINLSNDLIDQLAKIPFVRFTPGRPNWLFVLIYVFIIMTILLIWEAQPYWNRKLHLLLLTGLLFTFQNGWNGLSPFGEVTMIDVGQGDSILIQLPFGKGNYLIDTGGTVTFSEEQWRKRSKPFEVGRDVVVPFLKGKGITKIDKLILTHGDMDHIGGAQSILEELEIKQILMPSVVEPSETELEIVHEAKKKEIPVIQVSAGNEWKSRNSSFFILSPKANFAGERNRGSIAMFAKIGGINWFFGGDLDQEGEMEIINQYPQLTIDVLKAGHHGSKTSSAETFINQLKPRFALISVGEKNHFGHPHQEVLERFKKINTTIYRTDQQGAITYRFYQENGTFSSYLP